MEESSSMNGHIPRTYCNPLALPDYPLGIFSINKGNPSQQDFREMADPSVLYHEGKWYLYPSCGRVYVSEDFATWSVHHLDSCPFSYAPTVAYYKGMFYWLACGTSLYSSPSPTGPFTELGKLRKPSGEEFTTADPMIFVDDDQRVYLYWGIAGPGIFGAELDPNNLCRLVTEPKVLIRYNPEHEWERFGVFHENINRSFVEGSWMLKAGQTYYLTYAAPGTEISSYAMGAYIGETPLGPFRYQKRNPISRQQHGLIRGPGHGCIVKGPNGTLWAFYTLNVCYAHMFERRIGMDPAGIDENGELFVREASEIPQMVPGTSLVPERGNNAGILPVTCGLPAKATSCAPGRDAIYAVDDSMLTWWQPEAGDLKRQLTIDLHELFYLSSARLIWRDVGLNVQNGVLPGPFRYKIEASLYIDSDQWSTVLDCSGNDRDYVVDYREFEETSARAVRLTAVGAPDGIEPGVINFTMFGRSVPGDK